MYRDNGFTAAPAPQDLRVFRGNSLYDPDFTGVGVQPYGYDQLFPALYATYTVRASSIKVMVAPTTDVRLLRVIVVASRNTNLNYRDVSDLRAFGAYRMAAISWVNGMARKNIVRHYATTARMFPEYGKFGDDTLTAQYNTNPNQGWHWLVFFDTSTTGETASIQYDVEITYYATARKTDSLNES